MLSRSFEALAEPLIMSVGQVSFVCSQAAPPKEASSTNLKCKVLADLQDPLWFPEKKHLWRESPCTVFRIDPKFFNMPSDVAALKSTSWSEPPI